jgi:ADP-ribose pyrophosphatase YjhB (NUDIX family)
MEPALAAFLEGLERSAVEEAKWFDGVVELRIASYLHESLPPVEHVTSVRAVLMTEQGIAVMHNPNGSHILPGGRCEPGETIEQTLAREVLEEAGCEITRAQLVGFIHFQHQTPRPDDYPYPYPDFVQVVFAALGRVVSTDTDPDGWEQRVEFVTPDELRTRSLPPNEELFLGRALEVLGG